MDKNTMVVCNIDALPKASRPKSRIKCFGPQALTDSELVTYLLKRKTISDVDLGKIDRASREELIEMGFNSQEILMLMGIREYSRRSWRVENRVTRVSTSEGVARMISQDMSKLNHEEIKVIYLNCGQEIIAEENLYKGTEDMCVISPRELLVKALKTNAAKIILAHNHPTGSLQPSNEDIDLTTKMAGACHAIGMTLVDHIIISTEGYYSFAEKGLLM